MVGKTRLWIKHMSSNNQAISEEMEVPSGHEDVLKKQNATGLGPGGERRTWPSYFFSPTTSCLQLRLKSYRKEQIKTMTILSITKNIYIFNLKKVLVH